MKNTSRLLFALTLSLATALGCTDSSSGSGDDQTGDDGPSCGDGVCSSTESPSSCQTDCPVTASCGDGTCSGSETATSCPDDCGLQAFCGDGLCSGDETSANCTADCGTGAVCGDGVCNGTESSTSCPGDCAASNTCTSAPDTCTGDNVCVTGTCVPAFGRVYKLYMQGGKMTQNDAAGATWDSAGGLPDPYVNQYLNGTFLAATTTADDTLTPAWNTNTIVTVAAGAKLQFDVIDDDIGPGGQDMFSCFNIALTADVLRKHGQSDVDTCSPSGALSASTVRYYFVPQ
ncbi:MAG TPA: hypothetical protein VGM90_20320 [Kofleriaceae bacterium]|jgi:hypothetical protein